MEPALHYADYLKLDLILKAQELRSDQLQAHAHDEMLFIVIHQTYELWFKQLLYEVDSVKAILQKPSLNDDSPELQIIVHRLHRIHTILKLLVQQIEVMETMSPMDFLDFRDMLRPASGFQSWQFKLLEAKLGLKFEQRHGQAHYISQLRETEVSLIKTAESEKTLLELLNGWLERMPFLKDNDFWPGYRKLYRESLSEVEKGHAVLFDTVFSEENGAPGRSLSAAACRAGLFIMIYQGYPILQLPFQLLNQLLEIDEQLSTWRYRHMHMVHRTIGTRIGTGGSTGRSYLQGTLEKHFIFHEIAQLTSFLIERKKLPKLDRKMERRLGFSSE
ncbi:MAG: tryptophan 2,3-dioxygenase family protein [Bacteroidota bacterium]|nr:tryptophan 2,3-dioxygenase family protein [Bacteroidota bacterium]MDP4213254.1 tryptophan 2,3-dioxygenase family protein [Bacteroidota bacterium]